MKKITAILSSLVALMALLCFPAFAAETTTSDITLQQLNAGIKYSTYVEDSGWQGAVAPGNTSGTVGQSKAVDALRIDNSLSAQGISVNYSSYNGSAWSSEVSNGAVSGSESNSPALEAVKIKLTGTKASAFDVYYRVHSKVFGWLGWAKNGEVAGSTGFGLPVEGIEIVFVQAGGKAPGSTTNASVDASQITISLRTYVKGQGWTEPVAGSVSGTTGQSTPIEAIDLVVTDPTGLSGAVGEAHVQNIGWQGEANVNDAIGTTEQGLNLEAFKYRLVGPAAYAYDINYRAHVSNIGWKNWTANNLAAGTSGGNLPVEAADIVLTKKDQTAFQDNAYLVVQTPAGFAPLSPNCILINIDAQRMAYYKDYQLVVNTNVVTGMMGIDDTHRGDFTVMEKLPNYRTKGPGYDAVVDYWLTLYVGDIWGFDRVGHIVDRVGIHDAGWRSDWGSRAYINNGSHGCVNTPYGAMQTIYRDVAVGTPVYIR